MPTLGAETALRRARHGRVAPFRLVDHLGLARPGFVRRSDFRTIDTFSRSFHAEGAGRRLHQPGRCWSSRPMLRTRSQHEPKKCRKGTEMVPILYRWMRELIDLATVVATAKTRGGRQNSLIDDASISTPRRPA
jgi:hypothetical protein